MTKMKVQKTRLKTGAMAAFLRHGSRLRLCSPVVLRGDASDDKLLALAPLWEGVKLLPAPDPASFEARLQARRPGMAPFIRWAANELFLRRVTGRVGCHLPPILLWGTPGSGKTTLARMIAEAAGLPCTLYNLGGLSDARTWLGTSPGYATAAASAPASIVAKEGVANPVIILDEAEKIEPLSRNGSMHDALLSFLEVSSASNLYDEFLGTSVDLSHVVYIATANRLDALPEALLSRFHIFEVGSETFGADSQAREDLIGQVAVESGLDGDLLRQLVDEQPEFAEALEQMQSPRRAKALMRTCLAEMMRSRVLN